MYKVVIYLTPTNIALFLLFASAAFNCLAKYFYSNYRLVFGTLYPAYSSYKAIKRKDVREYTRWMMYWVCFGIFSATEFFTDIFLAFWFPFYYELKILFILWLMSPYGNGAKIFYKSIVHPELDKREEIIDSYINQATLLGFASLNHLWRRFSASFNNALAYGLQIAYSALTHRVQSSDVTDSAYSNTFFASILSRRSDANLRLFDDQTLTTRPRAVETYQQQPQSSSTPEPITIEEADLSEDDDYQPKQSLTRSSSNSSMETIPATASTRHHKGRLNGSSFDEESTASAFSLDESNEHEYVPEVGKKQRKTKVQPTTPTSSEVSSRPKRAAADRARGRFKELKD